MLSPAGLWSRLSSQCGHTSSWAPGHSSTTGQWYIVVSSSGQRHIVVSGSGIVVSGSGI